MYLNAFMLATILQKSVTFKLKHLKITILVSRSMFLRSGNLMVPDGAICLTYDIDLSRS